MRITKIAMILLIGIMLVLMPACGEGEEAAPTPKPTPTPSSGYKTYVDEVDGFSVSYPTTWDVDVNPGMYAPVWADYSPPITSLTSPCSYVTADSIIYIEEVPAGQNDVESYFRDFTEPFWLESEERISLSSQVILVDGIPAIKYIFADIPSKSDWPSTSMLVVLIREQTAWNIYNFVHSDCWYLYEDIFDTIINGFKVLD